LSNLRWLDISDNPLSSLPTEFWDLHNLEWLDTSWMRLTNFPSGIGQLHKLRFLDLSANSLTTLPSELWQLTNLQTLYLEGTGLTGIPPEIEQLANLQWLSLSYNQLHHLPTEIGKLDKLVCSTGGYCHLGLEGNPLISPPPEVVEQGTAAVLEYLRNQAWYHLQRMIIGAASGVGLLAAFVLGWRYRRTRGKSKRG
jgi:internalin A